jgi:hypothetical protein
MVDQKIREAGAHKKSDTPRGGTLYDFVPLQLLSLSAFVGWGCDGVFAPNTQFDPADLSLQYRDVVGAHLCTAKE